MHTTITVIRAEKAHKSLTKPTREALSQPSQRDSRLSLLWIGLLGA